MKKLVVVPCVGFKQIVVQLSCCQGDQCEPVLLDFSKMPNGAVGFALLFPDVESAAAFFPGEPAIITEEFELRSGLPPWDDARGEG